MCRRVLATTHAAIPERAGGGAAGIKTDRGRKVRCRKSAQRQADLRPATRRRLPVIYTLIGILVVLWLIGLVTSYTLGGFIHLLIVVAVIVFLVNIFRGKKLR
jgi:hypothetical protein